MSATEVRSDIAVMTPRARTMEMKLEVIVIPVSDVDRAKRFYASLSWRLDADVVGGGGFRVVQFTPPGSPCSIIFGTGVTSATPGSMQGLHLVVSDIEVARAELVGRGVEVSEVFHDAGGVFHHSGSEGRLSGPDTTRRSYASFASFCDPDGNGWVLQEITARLPGRVDADHSTFTASAGVQRAERAGTMRSTLSAMWTGRSGMPISSFASRWGASAVPRR